MATETPGVSTEVIDLTQDRISTYAAYYNSEQADAYQGSYTGLMNAYKVDDSLQVEGQRRARQSLWSSILQTRDVIILFSVYSSCLLIRDCIRNRADRCRSVATSKMNFSSEIVWSPVAFWWIAWFPWPSFVFRRSRLIPIRWWRLLCDTTSVRLLIVPFTHPNSAKPAGDQTISLEKFIFDVATERQRSALFLTQSRISRQLE